MTTLPKGNWKDRLVATMIAFEETTSDAEKALKRPQVIMEFMSDEIAAAEGRGDIRTLTKVYNEASYFKNNLVTEGMNTEYDIFLEGLLLPITS